MTNDFGEDDWDTIFGEDMVPDETRSERIARIRGIWEEQSRKDKVARLTMDCFLVYDAFGLDKVIELLIKKKAQDPDLDIKDIKTAVCHHQDTLLSHEEAMYLFMLEI